jgi:hypothetical protein
MLQSHKHLLMGGAAQQRGAALAPRPVARGAPAAKRRGPLRAVAEYREGEGPAPPAPVPEAAAPAPVKNGKPVSLLAGG